MAGSIATAYVQVVPSAKGIKGKLTSAFGSEGSAAGSSFGSGLIGKVKGLIATAGIGKMLTDSIMGGANLQQSLGGIETLFKDGADIVIKNAEQAYKTAGMSADSYMGMVTGFSASLLQGLSGDTEKAASIADMAMTDMSDNANKLGTDMGAVQNAYQGFAKQNYTMLDNLKLGYGGTKAEMERLLADANRINAEQGILTDYSIDNLADVYEAIHVVQTELGIAGATGEEAYKTLSGSFNSMKAAFSDLIANLALGRDINQSLQNLSESVTTFVVGNLMPAIGNVLMGLPTIISGALSMTIQGLNLVENNAESIVQMGIDLVTSIGTAIIMAAPYLAEAALNVVSALGGAIINTDWPQIGQDTINGLKSSLDLAAAEILGTDGNIVQSILSAIASGLPSVLDGGVSIVVEMANGILAALPGFLETAGDLMNQLLDTVLSMLPDMLASGVSLVDQLAQGLITNLPSVVKSAVSILAQLLATVASHLPQLLEQGISLVGQLAAGLLAAIPEVLSAGADIISGILDSFGEWDWGEIGSNIVSGIANGISAGASAIWQAAKKAASAALKAAKDFLGIASPSKVMRDQVGKFIPSGLAVGIKNNTKPLTDAMHDLSALTTDTLQSNLNLSSAAPVVSAPGRIYGDTNLTFHVYAAENQDEDKLVEKLMQKIQFAVAQKEAAIA